MECIQQPDYHPQPFIKVIVNFHTCSISSSSFSVHQDKPVMFTVHFSCYFLNEVVYIHRITHCDMTIILFSMYLL